MKKILGKEIRKDLEEKLSKRIARLPIVPVFCDLVVGNDPASLQYVSMKERYAERLGIRTVSAILPSSATTQDVLNTITTLSQKEGMSGLIVQLPLPAHIDRERVLDSIPEDIDVDCLGKKQRDLFYAGKSPLIYPTARAVMYLLEPHLDQSVPILVIGTGPLVGAPVTYLLRAKGYQVTAISKHEKDLKHYTQTHTTVISAAGIPGLIHTDMLSENTVIIDAGTSESDGSIVGDVDLTSLSHRPSYIAPVPGGVGPLTVYYLMENVVSVAERRYSTTDI